MKNWRRRKQSQSCSYGILEQRNLLATYLVNTIGDGDFTVPDGVISLREALVAASTNTAVGDAQAGDTERDVIRFDSTLAGQTITLTSGELSISGELAVFGDNNQITIDANSNSRIFNIDTSDQVVIRGLSLRNGTADVGGAIQTIGTGQTVLNQLQISSNTASGVGGALLLHRMGC